MSDNQEIDARFGDNAGRALRAQHPGQATQVEQARAIAEVRAAVMIAMDRPRNRSAAIAEMREVCGIMGLAERAFFRVPRGGQHVNGETIHLARELARCWGNIDYGVKELARDDVRGQSELLAFCWDLETNSRSEITFIIPHTRGTGNNRKPITGTQEIYENNASFAGRRLREAIFAVLPVWFKAEAAEICHKTLEGGGGKPLVQRIADLRTAFEAIGVSVRQLEEKRGRKIDNFLPEDVGALRVIYGSLKRSEVTIAEEFPSDEQTALRQNGSKLDALEHAAIATSGEPHPNSPAGTTSGNHADQPTPGKDAEHGQPEDALPGPAVGKLRPDNATTKPAGDTDLLGDKPAPQRNLLIPLKDVPSDNELNKFNDAIDRMLADGVNPADIRAANAAAIENLRRIDLHYFEDLDRKLGGA